MYVYVIVGHSRRVKVGISAQPAKRLKSLQTGSTAALRLHARVHVPDRATARAIEAQVHKLLSPRALAGEWFAVPPDDAENLVRQVMANLNLSVLCCPICGHVSSTKLLPSVAAETKFRCLTCFEVSRGRELMPAADPGWQPGA